jgi:hypothetical protein
MRNNVAQRLFVSGISVEIPGFFRRAPQDVTS